MPGKSSLSRALKQKLLDLRSVNLVSLGDAITGDVMGNEHLGRENYRFGGLSLLQLFSLRLMDLQACDAAVARHSPARRRRRAESSNGIECDALWYV